MGGRREIEGLWWRRAKRRRVGEMEREDGVSVVGEEEEKEEDEE